MLDHHSPRKTANQDHYRALRRIFDRLKMGDQVEVVYKAPSSSSPDKKRLVTVGIDADTSRGSGNRWIMVTHSRQREGKSGGLYDYGDGHGLFYQATMLTPVARIVSLKVKGHVAIAGVASLRDAAVRLAHGNADLRPHLLPLIEAADKDANIFSIEPGGLRRLETGGIHLQPNHIYWMGASTSPKMVIVTGVSDSSIQYTEHPYKTVRRIERLIGEDLIRQGTATWVKRYARYQPGLARALQGLLNGKPSSLKHKYQDYQRVYVYARPRKPDPNNPLHHADRGDLWRHMEQYGGVGGAADHYEVNTDRLTAREMKADPLIDIISLSEKPRR